MSETHVALGVFAMTTAGALFMHAAVRGNEYDTVMVIVRAVLPAAGWMASSAKILAANPQDRPAGGLVLLVVFGGSCLILSALLGLGLMRRRVIWRRFCEGKPVPSGVIESEMRQWAERRGLVESTSE